MAHLKMACVGYYFLVDPRKREKTSVREEMRSESVGRVSSLPSSLGICLETRVNGPTPCFYSFCLTQNKRRKEEERELRK
jgi:hypothetical protein